MGQGFRWCRQGRDFILIRPGQAGDGQGVHSAQRCRRGQVRDIVMLRKPAIVRWAEGEVAHNENLKGFNDDV
jgi:hypothetical protein